MGFNSGFKGLNSCSNYGHKTCQWKGWDSCSPLRIHFTHVWQSKCK